MEAVSTFLAMGGYAGYVWPAYGIAAVVLIGFAIDSWHRVRVAATELQRLEAADRSGKSAARTSRGAGPEAAGSATASSATSGSAATARGKSDGRAGS
jgi:heme exporter protein D